MTFWTKNDPIPPIYTLFGKVPKIHKYIGNADAIFLPEILILTGCDIVS